MNKKKIMVVDDDEGFLEELKDVLDNAGYDVTALSNSTTVTGMAESLKPDLIVMDLRMPSMSGFEVASKLRSLVNTCHIPVIAMTGFYTVEEKSFLMNFCAIKKCLKKPFNPLDIIKEIEWALGQDRRMA
jgi:CheY-like chemotaxis protein